MGSYAWGALYMGALSMGPYKWALIHRGSYRQGPYKQGPYMHIVEIT